MNEWEKCKLWDIALINSESIGNNFSYDTIVYLDTGSITRGKIDSYQTFNLKDAPSRAKRIVKDKDIIISMVRPIQRHYGFIKNPKSNTIVSTGFVVITCKEDVDPYFLYSYLTQDEITDYLDMIAEGSTSAYPAFTPDILENLTINLPPLPEQQAIASVLSSLDDKIDLLHRQTKTLEAMAETIFKKWFVEDIDDGFLEKPLSSIANFLNGLACQKFPPKNEIEKLPVLKIKELSAGISDSSDWATTKVNPEYIIHTGDVIFAWSASLMVKIWNGKNCILNQHLFKVTSDKYPKWFYYEWCKHHLSEFIVISSSHATTMGHIKREDLDNVMVLVPNETKLSDMSILMKPLLDKRITNDDQIFILEKLRDSLLPKLMSGEVRCTGFCKTIVNKKSKEVKITKSSVVTEEFKEAILISAFVRELATVKYPIGRKRYTKLCYLMKCKSSFEDQKIFDQYKKFAAGPYDPGTRYKGPEGIAIRNKYIIPVGKEAFIKGEKAGDIDKYFNNYWYKSSFDWIIDIFKYRKTEELGLIASVDYAKKELQRQGISVNASSILKSMKESDEWKHKPESELFSVGNINKTLKELEMWFGE